MRKKIVLIALPLCLSICFSFKLLAQEKPIPKHHLSLFYGVQYNMRFDAVYSRLPRYGGSHNGTLQYEYKSKTCLLTTALGFSTGTWGIKDNPISQLLSYNGQFKLHCLFNLTPSTLQENKLAFYLGGNLGFGGEIWFPESYLLAYGWDINLGLGLSAALHYAISPKLSLQYDFNFHCLGVLWRPHNNGQQLITEELQKEKGTLAAAFETPRFAHVLNTIYMENRLRLVYHITNNLALNYAFILAYKHLKQPLIKKGIDINNTIGLTYKF
ncbi:hypothetical protein [Aureispira anguillae]|uniref:Uncharacterized protein n=1 Tax=Aureispira anguillae TaxID=2864201 RepID=A0A915YCE6_9BACT|nr:hypothetical protein [Aureispira anguillae]BDS10514.1 hypothetical protein AsAng_0012220 [Aureispira anguillae]